LWEFNLLAFTPSFVLVSRSSKNLHISPSNLFEISIGLILGDLHISNYKSVSARFQVEQGLIHEDYLLHYMIYLKIIVNLLQLNDQE
jgi:hypothetical protein